VKIHNCFKWSLFIVSLIFASGSNAQTSESSFTPAQQKQIENIIHHYIVNNPEILIEATNVLKSRQIDQANKMASDMARKNADQLLRNKQLPTLGNPNGKITMVEFFDYQCMHCRSMPKTLENLIKANPDLHIVFVDFPIFGPASVLAAKAGLAANKQGKFEALYVALMTTQQPLTEQNILNIAKKVGVNVDQLKKDMAAPSIDRLLKENYKIANAMQLIGTPEFIITRSDLTPASNAIVISIPGAVPQQALQDAINKI